MYIQSCVLVLNNRCLQASSKQTTTLTMCSPLQSLFAKADGVFSFTTSGQNFPVGPQERRLPLFAEATRTPRGPTSSAQTNDTLPQSTRRMSASSSSTLVLSPAFGGPQAGSVVHEAKVFASAAFNYVVALIFVILPSIVFCYTISGTQLISNVG